MLLKADGRQTQTMSYNLPVGPLTDAQRKNGPARVVHARHRHYGTLAWGRVRKRFGNAHDPKQHNDILEVLLRPDDGDSAKREH